ncbi:MAG: SRPBCC domain-containing protein [Deltaproteobacteria bacterium]|nr:SRPBCC domain-containing protein [Deltaproteobacteria bacterium]
MSASSAEPTWSADREIVLSRVFDAPRELVFKVWTDREHISKWFGPRGFTTVTRAMDARVGGQWRFDMTAPDGTVFTNRVTYLEIVPPERLVFDHGSDRDDDPNQFRVTVTFDEQSDKKTVVTMRQLHPTRERRNAGIGFGAVELGYQTLDKLAAHLQTGT